MLGNMNTFWLALSAIAASAQLTKTSLVYNQYETKHVIMFFEICKSVTGSTILEYAYNCRTFSQDNISLRFLKDT